MQSTYQSVPIPDLVGKIDQISRKQPILFDLIKNILVLRSSNAILSRSNVLREKSSVQRSLPSRLSNEKAWRPAEAEAAEQAAADRIFGMLPEPEATEFRALWDEYEDQSTPEGRFAYSCDRLQPLLLNVAIDGGSWRRHGVSASRVKQVNGKIEIGLPSVWPAAEATIDANLRRNILLAASLGVVSGAVAWANVDAAWRR